MKLRAIAFIAILGFVTMGMVGCSTSSSTDTSNLDGQTMTVYYSPSCSCCGRYVNYLENEGLNVETVQTHNRELTRAKYGVPHKARSCHTSVMGDYFVEGHVPVETIARLKRQQPDIAGVTIPGMPKHAPGMGGPNGSTLEIISVSQDKRIKGVYEKQSY